MEAGREPVVDEAAFRAADAAYAGFPSFDDWAGLRMEEDLWARYRERVESLRLSVPESAFERAIDITVREAAVDTGAIEGLYSVDRGFTYSVATEAATWQVEAAEKGAEVQALLQAQLAAYELMLDVATKKMPVTEVWIRGLHEVLTRAQDTYRVLTPSGWQDQELPKGRYKTQPNHPWRGDRVAKSYAPVSDTPAEMHELVEQLARADFKNAHPVLQAAFAHYSLVAIHPFADGNGRVARALASVYLYRSDRIPLLVYADQQRSYIQALEDADSRTLQSFADYIFDRGISTLARVADLLRAAGTPERADSVSALRNLTTSIGGLSYPEIDTTAQRLLQLVQEEIGRQAAELGLPPTVRAEVAGFGRVQGSGDVSGYRRPIHPSPGQIGFKIESGAPATGSVQQPYDVLVAMPPRERATFLVRRLGTDDQFEASLAEVHPEPSEDLRYRIRLFIQAALNEKLAEVSKQAEASLRSQGYLPAE